MAGYTDKTLKMPAPTAKMEFSPPLDVEKMMGGSSEQAADLAAVTQALMAQRQKNSQAMVPGVSAQPQIDAALLAALGKKQGV